MADYTYIAIDPGKANGVAIYNASTGCDLKTFNVEQVYTFLDVGLPSNAFLIVESFIINARTAKLQNPSVTTDVIGACDFVSFRTDTPMVRQTPANRVPEGAFIGVFGRQHGGNAHERSALGHLTSFMSAGPDDSWMEFKKWME